MSRMLGVGTIGVLMAGVLVGAAGAEESVVLRTASGQLLRVAEGGLLKADHRVPRPQEMFFLVSGKDGRVAVRTYDGRWLTAEAGGVVRAQVGAASQQFTLTRLEGNRAALRGPTGWLLLDPAAASAKPAIPPPAAPASVAKPESAAKPVPADAPRPEQSIELYRLSHVPALLQDQLANLIHKVVVDELGNKPYEKTRTRKREKAIKLPAPTLRNLARKQSQRVLGMMEEYRIRVQLTGEPSIRVLDMPYLQGYYDRSGGALMFSIQAALPLQGEVNYRIPELLSATTGFHVTVMLTASGEILSRKEKEMTLQPPKLQDLDVGIRDLNIANDALNLVREPLEDIINQELREKNDRIREKANQSIQKAIESKKFNSPMLQWLLKMAF